MPLCIGNRYYLGKIHAILAKLAGTLYFLFLHFFSPSRLETFSLSASTTSLQLSLQ